MRDEIYRTGSREMIKFGTFVGMLSGFQLGLEHLRQRDDLANLAVAGALSGALFRLRAGPAAAVTGSIVGLALSSVLGATRSGLRMLEDRVRASQPVPEPPVVHTPPPAPRVELSDEDRTAGTIAILEERRKYLFPQKPVAAPPQPAKDT
jgi:hypothetical protein